MSRRGLAINSRWLEFPLLRRLERQAREITAGAGYDKVRRSNVAIRTNRDPNFYPDLSMNGLARAERNLRQNLFGDSLRGR